MTATSNQTLVVTALTIIAVVVLIALHDMTAAAGIPLIGVLSGVHLGANVIPSAPVAPVAPVVTPVAGNPVQN